MHGLNTTMHKRLTFRLSFLKFLQSGPLLYNLRGEGRDESFPEARHVRTIANISAKHHAGSAPSTKGEFESPIVAD